MIKVKYNNIKYSLNIDDIQDLLPENYTKEDEEVAKEKCIATLPTELVFLYSEESIKAVEDSEEEYFKCYGANDITDRVGYFIESFDWECIKNN